MAEYIEKQKAIKLLDMCMVAAEKRWKEATNPLAKIEFKADKDTIEAMIEVVVSVESADVQPVKRGRWIITDDVEHFIAICSECGRTEDSRGIKDMPYCHCGARMDGDNNA